MEYLAKNKINEIASYQNSRPLPFDYFADNTDSRYNTDSKYIDMVSKLEELKNNLENLRSREFKLRKLIDGVNKIDINLLQNYVSPKQFNAFMHSSDPKYLDVKRILSDGKK